MGSVTIPKSSQDATASGIETVDRLGLLVDAEIDDVPAAEPTRVGSRRALAYLGMCLVLIGLNLRTVFSSFSAVLPEVTADAGLPGWAVVVLTTVPVTLLGVFAPLAPVVARPVRCRAGAAWSHGRAHRRPAAAARLSYPRSPATFRRCWPGQRPAVPRSPCATCCCPAW